MTTFSERTIRQLYQRGFVVQSSAYLVNCMEIHDVHDGWHGLMTEQEARERLLGERKDGEAKR